VVKPRQQYRSTTTRATTTTTPSTTTTTTTTTSAPDLPSFAYSTQYSRAGEQQEVYPNHKVELDAASSVEEPSTMINDILKNRGLFAMAKFLRDSGLDTILNETGTYTII
jgi:uncharacterized surface protein with fasciclin (FAS1) repeats